MSARIQYGVGNDALDETIVVIGKQWMRSRRAPANATGGSDAEVVRLVRS